MKLFVLTLLMSFSVMAFDPTIKVEYAVNDGFPKTDILFVIDNSGSMDGYQKLLAELSDNFLNQMKNADFKITAISTDKADSLNTVIIDSASKDPISELGHLMTSFGTNGDATELVFQRTYDFVNSVVGKNFMRKQAPLEIIIVTDELEQSEQSVEEMMKISRFKKFTVSGLLPSNAGNPNCHSYPRGNSKIEELVTQSGGITLDLCKSNNEITNDYEALAKAIIKRGYSKVLPITKYVFRDDIDTNSIKVYYGSQIIQRGFVGTGWTYEEGTKTLYFGQNIVLSNQPAGTKLTIQYDIL